jgi:transforming growth factor-beta-induced protein
MIRWIRAAIAAFGISLLAACGGNDDETLTAPTPGTIAQVASASNLTALVAAADKAGLVPTLSSSTASLTVLAPTDAAFTALATSLGFPSATAMVQALPAAALQSILQYHVIAGRVSAAQVISGGASQPTLYSFAGSPARLGVSTSGGVAFTDAVLTQARVTTADVAASNGVVHVIDKVLVPPGVLNIVQMAQANPAFSTLVSAVAARNLVPTLSGAGPFTVFAPTNDAFAAIQSTVAALTPDQLSTVLTYHVLGAEVLSTGIPFGTAVPTAAAPRTITITAGPAPTIASIADSTSTPASITAVDIRASNGVIHVIDKVLIPSPL